MSIDTHPGSDGANPKGLVLTLPRLSLVSATPETLRAELLGSAMLASVLGVEVPSTWPPGEYDREAVRFFLDRYAAEGSRMNGWLGWYAIYRQSDCARPIAVGAGGYFGPPSTNGTVEIGYSILEPWQSRGFATELVAGLIKRLSN